MLYRADTRGVRWGLWNTHACALLMEPPAAQAGTGHLPRSIFLTEFYLPNLHYQDSRIIFIDKLWIFRCFILSQLSSFIPLYFSKCSETDQVKAYLPTIIIGEMYPVRLCTHILPDVLWHDDSGSWSGLRAVLESVRLFNECFSSTLDFAMKSWGIGRQLKV